MRKLAWLRSAAILLVASPVAADGIGDFLDAIDLNDYALGVNLYSSESRYAGVDNFTLVYPLPQKFSHSLFTKDTFFVRSGNLGLRKVYENGWTLGGIVGLQTYGYGSNNSEVTLGMARRNWTIQAGGLVGKSFGPLNIELDASADVLGEHNGFEAGLSAAWIFRSERFEFVPEIKAVYESAKLLNHYFGVRPTEALPGRPAYTPGAALTWTAILDWSWRLTPRWYVSTVATVDVLPDEIRNSPLVDKDTAWRFNLTLAYDAASFVELESAGTDSVFDLNLSAFFTHAESSIDFLFENDRRSVDLESEANLDEDKLSVPLDLSWRLGRYHGFELGYFNLNRSGTVQGVVTDFDTQTIRAGYGFSFFRDRQKELTLFGGLHVTEIDFRVRDAAESIDAATTTWLPIIGTRFNANLTDRLSLGVSLDLFTLDFDRHSGLSLDFILNGMYRLNDRFYVGGGYRFFRQDIDVAEDSFTGDFRMDYRGFFTTLRVRF